MTDERFIELLNLYIDRELSGDEVREVEEAIAANPERQRMYQQYCRMECACEELFSSAEAPKPSIAALVAKARALDEADEAEVIEFGQAARESAAASAAVENSASGMAGWRAALGLMAACVAVAFYFLNAPATNSGLGMAELDDAPAVAAATTVTPAAQTLGPDDSPAALAETPTYRTVFVLGGEEGGRSDIVRVSSNAAASSDPFAWMERMTFEPIQRVNVDELEFHTARPVEMRNLSAFSYPYPGLDDTPPVSETAAFEFQR